MVLACNNISKAFADKTILSNCTFHIEDKEKAAIVGINGAGKSTLLKIIMGELDKDEGEVILGNGKTLGYLAQHQNLSEDAGIYTEMLKAKKEILDMEEKMRETEIRMKHAQGEELESLMKSYTRLTHEFELADGFAYKSEVAGIIRGLGFKEEEFHKPVKTLSGGQKTRVSLGKLLLQKPDIILLDEPTNHLDMQSINWLENYLVNYKGSVIVVAHDRFFLDRVVAKIVEIDRGKVTVFSGNYSAYAQKKEKLMDSMLKQYFNQQKEIKAQEEVIAKLRSFNREKFIKRAESREKLLEKMVVLEKPETKEQKMSLALEPAILSGKDVLSVKGLEKRFGEKLLFSQVDFEVKRGERTAVIGDNGTGKTTLLKIINGIIPADAGETVLGSKVKIGYYDQEHHILDPKKTIFEEISDAYPGLDNTKIRNVLAAFMFTGEEVFKQIEELSGGERGRVSLAKLMLSEANFLILDEPTNHLDIMSKEILEMAIINYTGTVIYVSHDRYFINKTATRILELSNTSFTNYIGNYDYYQEKKESLSLQAGKVETEEEQLKQETSRPSWAAKKEEQAKIRKRENDLKKTEERIQKLEVKVKEFEKMEQKEEIYTDINRLMEIHKEKENITKELDSLYEMWESLM